ncbi:uncharacterized protein [Canis lupus baileyi]|uniref:uncharacterized protein isoform X3 n=1 Tax=Canis lupus baileyi TaxID=143281 RepID=UPI003B97BDE4
MCRTQRRGVSPLNSRLQTAGPGRPESGARRRAAGSVRHCACAPERPGRVSGTRLGRGAPATPAPVNVHLLRAPREPHRAALPVTPRRDLLSETGVSTSEVVCQRELLKYRRGVREEHSRPRPTGSGYCYLWTPFIYIENVQGKREQFLQKACLTWVECENLHQSIVEALGVKGETKWDHLHQGMFKLSQEDYKAASEDSGSK